MEHSRGVRGECGQGVVRAKIPFVVWHLHSDTYSSKGRGETSPKISQLFEAISGQGHEYVLAMVRQDNHCLSRKFLPRDRIVARSVEREREKDCTVLIDIDQLFSFLLRISHPLHALIRRGSRRKKLLGYIHGFGRLTSKNPNNTRKRTIVRVSILSGSGAALRPASNN